MPEPRDLAEHEEEFLLYRWGPELDKYLAAQICDTVATVAGAPSRPLEARLLRFSDGGDDKKQRLKESQAAIRRAASSGSGWITPAK